MTSKKVQTLGEQLLQRGRSPASGVVAVLPVSEIPMVLMLDQLRPNPDNPRTTRNPKYDDIKASIQARGLDSVPKVTKNPDSADDVYIFSDGGNTRYTILMELWEETQDERFRRIQCIFKPWPGRLKCVIGHLAENDVRGDLLFIEKALGIAKAKSIYEEQIGKAISQRELELFLRTEGYPVSQSSISRMEYTLDNLYPYMPGLFNSGIGRPQVAQLITLRSAAQKAWNAFSTESSVSSSFDEVFGEVCRSLDDPDHYTLETFKDELIAALLQAIPNSEITYDRWLIELDPKEQNRRKLFGEPAPLPQHIINADKGTENEGGTPAASSLAVPPSDDSQIKEKLPIVHRQPDAVISLQDVKPSVAVDADTSDHEQCKEEEQLDLYGLPNESRESTLPVTFPPSASSGAVLQDANPSSVLESATSDSSVSFANTGLEPVTDIWHISALQDDIEHLQDAAFRLAFELAEVLEAEQELCEDNAPGSAGYRLQVNVHQASPITRLLAGISGDAAVSLSATELTNIVIGTEQPADWPLLDDIQVVKFLRLIRVIRRLREIQRQSQQYQNGEE
ncbi:ParB family protein [Yersinia ruckeri]|uniref:ParB family protein n=1 Tax=Yersinia ruckeri TaxID=29486 RepID=UPI000689DCDD|nr:ParB family protein [Yersinia ruckeri]AUQ41269.1 hypothetical protein NJ56_04610 [Yersinia ruckeri]MCW6527981.1 ParB family protein [Yersinia ruckeri]MCW6563153.1 ParB family protein [Yersinia ruckeri]UIM97028.1 ParB family protein [Yersinia ruckeri]UZY05093.1 ParB family protein [Yersinia ruckeri]